MKQLGILQREIEDSQEELEKISPLYENQVVKEKEITKGYVCRLQVCIYLFLLHVEQGLRLIHWTKSQVAWC